jgi:predicted transposase YbfD/YdcC
MGGIMSRRKRIDPSILEASKQFDAQLFAETIQGEFYDFPDARSNRKRIVYPVWYICLVILCGFFCGCNTIEEIAEYASLQQAWFEKLLGKSHPSPSYSTLWWFLVRTPSEILKRYFKKWFIKLPNQLQDQLLALDGKRLKSASFLEKITHLVELFAAEDRLVLAVEKVPDKTVEKSCLPVIFQQVNVSGAIISGDAHFTVPTSATEIVDNDADYLLAVKGNQPSLHDEMQNFFLQGHRAKWEGIECSYVKSIEKNHGRIETREVRVIHEIDWLPQKEKWKKLSSLIEVRSTREFLDGRKPESSTRFYISSRKEKAFKFAKWIREHWGIENHVHWIADVIYREDEAKTDIGYSAENMGIFRRLAMNMAVIADPERGMASIRRAAAFGTGYLQGILSKIFLQKPIKSF